MILSVRQHMFLWSRVDEQAFHKRRYSKNELVEKVRPAGFEVVYATSFMSLLSPINVSDTVRQEKKVADEMAEFRISGVTNEILSLCSRSNFATSTFGVTFPAGGSLLLVARKLRSPDAIDLDGKSSVTKDHAE